jgi:hypothetical protein
MCASSFGVALEARARSVWSRAARVSHATAPHRATHTPPTATTTAHPSTRTPHPATPNPQPHTHTPHTNADPQPAQHTPLHPPIKKKPSLGQAAGGNSQKPTGGSRPPGGGRNPPDPWRAESTRRTQSGIHQQNASTPIEVGAPIGGWRAPAPHRAGAPARGALSHAMSEISWSRQHVPAQRPRGTRGARTRHAPHDAHTTLRLRQLATSP